MSGKTTLQYSHVFQTNMWLVYAQRLVVTSCVLVPQLYTIRLSKAVSILDARTNMTACYNEIMSHEACDASELHCEGFTVKASLHSMPSTISSRWQPVADGLISS
jgi:hypothetical protein